MQSMPTKSPAARIRPVNSHSVFLLNKGSLVMSSATAQTKANRLTAKTITIPSVDQKLSGSKKKFVGEA